MIKKVFAILLVAVLFICSATTVCVYAEQYADSEYLLQQENDVPDNDSFDAGDEAVSDKNSVKTIVICIIAGMAIGFIINFSIASKNKSVRMQRNASVYTRPGSMVLTGSADNFLYSNIERRAKPKQNNKQ